MSKEQCSLKKAAVPVKLQRPGIAVRLLHPSGMLVPLPSSSAYLHRCEANLAACNRMCYHKGCYPCMLFNGARQETASVVDWPQLEAPAGADGPMQVMRERSIPMSW